MICGRCKNERGIVLLTVLLFLVVLSILVLAMLNTSLLETKMGSNYFATLRSFYQAESKLRQNELELLEDKNMVGANLIQQVCGVDFYRVSVDVVSEGGDAGKVKLQSVVAKVGDVSKCTPRPKAQGGRESWREVVNG